MMYDYDIDPPYGRRLRYGGKLWPLAYVSDDDRLAIMDMQKHKREATLKVMEREIEAAKRWKK
jgi:hypothetical protein